MIVEEYKKEKERLKWKNFRDSSDLPNLKEKHKKIVDRIGEYLQISKKVVVRFEEIEGAEGDLHLIFEDGSIKTHGWDNDRDYIIKKLKNHGKKIGKRIPKIPTYEGNDKIERRFKKVQDMLKDYESPPKYEYKMEITNLPRYVKTDKELFTNGKPIFRKSVTLRVYGSSTGITFGFFTDNDKEVGKDSVGVAYKNDNSILRLSQVNVEGLVRKFKKDWKRVAGKCDKILKKW